MANTTFNVFADAAAKVIGTLDTLNPQAENPLPLVLQGHLTGKKISSGPGI